MRYYQVTRTYTETFTISEDEVKFYLMGPPDNITEEEAEEEMILFEPQIIEEMCSNSDTEIDDLECIGLTYTIYEEE